MIETMPHPFQERSGQAMAPIAEALAAPPEFPLSPEERVDVLAYEHGLFDRPVGHPSEERTIGATLLAYEREDIAAPSFFAKPFIDGRIQTEGMPVFQEPYQVHTWLAEQVETGKAPQEMRDLAKQSLEYYKDDLADELLGDKPIEEVDPLIIEAQSLVLEPETTLQQINRLQDVRDMLREEYRRLKPAYGEWNTPNEARCSILEVYMAKVNDQMADYWPRVSYVIDHALRTDNHELWLAASRLQPSWEVIADEAQRSSFHARLDYVRHGMGLDERGRAHPVTHRLWQLATKEVVTDPREHNPRFTPEQAAQFRTIKLEPEQVRTLIEDALSRAELLSAVPPLEGGGYDVMRKKPPADHKWQAVYHPTKNTFMVDAVSMAYMVPSTPSSLYSVLIVGGAHELEHVNQGEADAAVAAQLKIAQVKGKRVSPLREGGAMVPQRAWAEALFGEPNTGRPLMTYASALSTLREGKNLAVAAQAFFTELRERKPNKNIRQDARNAADRVVRLRRADGHSSQPLSYAEDQLLADTLQDASPAAQARAAKMTCFDLPDQLRFHKFGLLPTPPEGRDLMKILLEVAEERGYLDV